MKKYFNLYKTIKNKIINGEYKADEKLPSKRVMADMSGYSLITVEHAYNMLADEGYIKTKERSGYYVCRLELLSAGATTARDFKLEYLPEPELSPKNTDFEYSVWFKTIRKVISENGSKLFVKSPNKGCAVLRNAVADYLHRYRSINVNPSRIIIGSGSEQLYENAVQILGRDKIYGIENPSYTQIEAVYRGMGVPIKKLKMGCDGVESSELSGCFDVLHVTPFYSYPTGVTTSISKRYEYLKWAGKDKYIIEDDFASEFSPPGQPVETLYSLDGGGKVIYINTFSKSLSPSMRMGYMILPESLLEQYDERLEQYSCSVPVLDQYVLSEFISSGNFERHLNRMRRKMKKQKNNIDVSQNQ